jgi:hypothetical protein
MTLVYCGVVAFPLSSFGQELPRIGVGAKMSTLGIGFEAATAVASRSNLRGGFNFFNYDTTVSEDGIHYDAVLKLRSIQATFDQYVFRGLHASPGVLIYNGNGGKAVASVPAGQSFSLGGVTYISPQSVSGTATVKMRKVAPMVLFGVGNLLPRNSRRLGFNVDFGVVFQGSPEMTLNLAGTACTAGPATSCLNLATDPTVQSNVKREQDKLNDDLQPLKYYPVVSAGISWKF